MRILLAHNFYQSSAPSGEDVVYRNERALLESSGHEVIAFERHNDDITSSVAKRFETALNSAWSSESYRTLRKLIAAERPDVAHFHNTFPLITPSAYRACHDEGVPVVQTLHNYRLLCPGGLFLRAGAPCERCLDTNLAHSIRHACYRDSRVATAIVAAGLQTNWSLGTFARYVDRYIALTHFAKAKFVRAGLPADCIVVRPNGLAEAPQAGAADGDFVLYIGRLSAEKGVSTLLRAWSLLRDIPLKIIGDGALRPELELQARASHAPVEFLGYRKRPEVWALLRRARLLIIPSECYEGFPMTLLEGLAAGIPLAVSAIGALDEIVRDPDHGAKFAPGDAQSLAEAVRRIYDDPVAHRLACRANRALFERYYGPELMLKSLEEIYSDVIASMRRDSLSAAHPA